MPRGSHRLDVNTTSGFFTFWGTGTWHSTPGSDTAKQSCGAVTMVVSATVTVPLSLLGLIVNVAADRVLHMSIPAAGKCVDSALTPQQLQQLATSSALPRTFMRGIQPAVPEWLELSPDPAGTADLSGVSDTVVGIASGSEAKGIDSCAVCHLQKMKLLVLLNILFSLSPAPSYHTPPSSIPLYAPVVETGERRHLRRAFVGQGHHLQDCAGQRLRAAH